MILVLYTFGCNMSLEMHIFNFYLKTLAKLAMGTILPLGPIGHVMSLSMEVVLLC